MVRVRWTTTTSRRRGNRDDSEQFCSDPVDSVHEGSSPNNRAFHKAANIRGECAVRRTAPAHQYRLARTGERHQGAEARADLFIGCRAAPVPPVAAVRGAVRAVAGCRPARRQRYRQSCRDGPRCRTACRRPRRWESGPQRCRRGRERPGPSAVCQRSREAHPGRRRSGCIQNEALGSRPASTSLHFCT